MFYQKHHQKTTKIKKILKNDTLGTIHKLCRQPEGEGGSEKVPFLPIMPNMFAYEGGEGGSKIRKIMPSKFVNGPIAKSSKQIQMPTVHHYFIK